jgi:hypothetical protein
LYAFTNGRLPQNLQFTYSNSEIEIVKEFNYLGLLLTKTGNFKRAIKTLADKGTKAMYEILKRGKFHNLSISCQLDLFDKVVKPILLYGCELWGLSNSKIVFTLFNQEKFAFCVLHKWYIKRYTTEQIKIS